MSWPPEQLPPPPARREAQALATTPDWQAGRFRAAPSSPLFRHSTSPGHSAIVFPRRSVGLVRGRAYQLADVTKVILHNDDSHYSRRPLDPAGDECFWYWLSDELLEEISPSRSVVRRIGGRHRFAEREVQCSREHFQRERRIAQQLLSPRAEPAEIEESILLLLADVLTPDAKPSRGIATTRLADATDEFLAEHFAAAPDLATVASAVGCSKFHLARTYRQLRGQTIQARRTELQLRAAYDLVAAGELSLTDIAMDLGFSSPSHFSTRFKQFFGVSPSSAARAH